MASFHLNVFFNCPFFSRSIRGTCKENKDIHVHLQGRRGQRVPPKQTRSKLVTWMESPLLIHDSTLNGPMGSKSGDRVSGQELSISGEEQERRWSGLTS